MTQKMTSQPHRFSNPPRIREAIQTQAGNPFKYQSWEDVPAPLRIQILEQVLKTIETSRGCCEDTQSAGE